MHRVRIDHQAAVVGARYAEYAYGAGRALDGCLDAHRDIILRLLVVNVRNPPPLQQIARALKRRGARGPIHHLAEPLERLSTPRIGQESKPQCERICVGRRGELVKETFHREDVPDFARRAQVRNAQWRGRQPPDLRVDVLDGVGRVGVHSRESRLRPSSVVETGGDGREQRYPGVGGIHRRHRYRFPSRNGSIGSQRRPQIKQLRRPFGVPPVLVLAHPLRAHRAAELPRQERRLEGDIVISVCSVAAGAIHIDEAKLRPIEPQQLRNRPAHAMRRLRGRPNRTAIVADVGDRAGWTHRGVRLHRPRVSRMDNPLRLIEHRGGIAHAAQHLDARDWRGAHRLEEIV